MGIVRNFSLFDFKSKVTERENFDFSLPGGVCATLVKAGKICYAEFEKKSNKESLGKNKKDILAIMKQLDLVPIAKFQFYDLCERLSRFSDRKFTGSAGDFKRLNVLLKKY